MNEQTSRGMGFSTTGQGVSVSCPSCKTPAFRLRAGSTLAARSTPGAVESARPCPSCGGVVRVFVVAS